MDVLTFWYVIGIFRLSRHYWHMIVTYNNVSNIDVLILWYILDTFPLHAWSIIDTYFLKHLLIHYGYIINTWLIHDWFPLLIHRWLTTQLMIMVFPMIASHEWYMLFLRNMGNHSLLKDQVPLQRGCWSPATRPSTEKQRSDRGAAAAGGSNPG